MAGAHRFENVWNRNDNLKKIVTVPSAKATATSAGLKSKVVEPQGENDMLCFKIMPVPK